MADDPNKLEYESREDLEREPANWGVLVAALAIVPISLLLTLMFKLYGLVIVVGCVAFFLYLRSRKGV